MEGLEEIHNAHNHHHHCLRKKKKKKKNVVSIIFFDCVIMKNYAISILVFASSTILVLLDVREVCNILQTRHSGISAQTDMEIAANYQL